MKRNLVNQEFSVTRPNEIWASDITYFKIKGYAVYLCAIIDLFSRRAVGYRVSRKCSTHLVTATFKDAFRARSNPTDLTFHSDRGGQYTSDTLFKLLNRAASSNPSPALAVPVTTQWPRHSLLRLSGKKRIEGTTPLRQIFEKVWTSMCASITNNGPIRRWHTSRRYDLRNFMGRKRHRLVRKPVSKKRSWINIFLQLFLIFRNIP
ncbi:DDE domain-containing protein [Acutalibacter sp. 1XD8-33]|nr:DDE domain-containing protein [Acutalibacter sp. 1XD8-33]